MQPSNQTPDFDFIMNDNKAQKSGLLTGGSKKRKIIIVFLGVSVLFIVIFLFISLLTSSGSSNKETLLGLAQKQTEVIRVSTIGTQKARDVPTLNLATNTNLSITSLQSELLGIMSKNDIKTKPKDLALGQDSKTDAALTSAEQSARFDEVFLEVMTKQLKEYQSDLTAAYEQSDSKSQKEYFTKAYSQTKLLLGEDNSKN